MKSAYFFKISTLCIAILFIQPSAAFSSTEFSEMVVKRLAPIYIGLDIRTNGKEVTITSPALNTFGQLREAIAHAYFLDHDHGIKIEELCLGRECDKVPLYAKITFPTTSKEKSKLPLGHFIGIQKLLDELARINGTLVSYKIEKTGTVSWEALIPPEFADKFGQTIGKSEDGRARVRNSL